jgi:hypothetical protein
MGVTVAFVEQDLRSTFDLLTTFSSAGVWAVASQAKRALEAEHPPVFVAEQLGGGSPCVAVAASRSGTGALIHENVWIRRIDAVVSRDDGHRPRQPVPLRTLEGSRRFRMHPERHLVMKPPASFPNDVPLVGLRVTWSRRRFGLPFGTVLIPVGMAVRPGDSR